MLNTSTAAMLLVALGAGAAIPDSAYAEPVHGEIVGYDHASLVEPRLVILAGAALAAGSVGSALWWAEREEAVVECATGEGCANGDGLQRSLRIAKATTVSLGIGSIITGALGGLWLFRRRRSYTPILSADAQPTRGLYELRARFWF